MSFNFSQLQQSVDRLLINSSEAINKLVDLTIAPARDVTVQYYDRNGNLVTQTTPNMMKVLNTVQTNINSYMDKVVYVDPNGDDNNDGTPQRPVKTIKRAIEDLIPVGGRGYIVLRSGVHTLTSDVNIWAKTIVIAMNGDCTLTTNWYEINGQSNIYAFRLHNAFLRIGTHNNANATILIPPRPNNLPASIFLFASFIQVPDLYTASITIRPSDVSNFTFTCNDIPFIRNIGGIVNIIFHFNFLSGYNLDFNINNGFLIANHGNNISLVRFFSNRVLRKDGDIVFDPANGGIRNLKTLLSNIVYHPNTNIPANYVVSNPNDFGF